MNRRNLNDLDRVGLLEIKGRVLKEQAKERMQKGGGDKRPGMVKSPDPLPATKPPVREQLAQEAGMGGQRYSELAKIGTLGAPELKEAVRKKEISAHAGAKIAQLPESEQIKPN